MERTPTEYEKYLMSKYSLTFKGLCDVRFISKGLHIPLTLGRACELYLSGDLQKMKENREKQLTELEDVIDKVKNVELSKRDSDDDVAKLLKDILDRDDKKELGYLMLKCKCEESKVLDLIEDWARNRANKGIIRMRAGNMLRNALRRKVL